MGLGKKGGDIVSAPRRKHYIFDVFHEFLAGISNVNGAPFRFPRTQIFKSALKSLYIFLGGCFRKSDAHSLGGSFESLSPKIWAYTTTINQHDGVAPILEELSANSVDLFALHPADIWGRSIYISALLRLPKAVWILIRLPRSQSKRIANQVELLALILAEGARLRKAIRNLQPSAFIISNDHSPRNRGIIRVVAASKTPLVYVQHAAVGGVERALDCMTAALLQGQHSLDIYRGLGGITADIHLIGSPKMDAAREAHGRKRASESKIHMPELQKQIGIFPGFFDSVEHVVELVQILSKSHAFANICVRPHPRDQRYKEWEAIDLIGGKVVSSKNVASSDFLLSCDVAIFDDSNIGLEACALEIPIVKYPLKDTKTDQYQLGETGIFQSCEASRKTIAAMAGKALALQLPRDPEKTAYFFHNFGTKQHGKSHIIAAQIISDLAMKNTPDNFS